MKTEQLTKREQAMVIEIKAAIAEVEPRRHWISPFDLAAFAALTLIGVAAYRLFF